MRHLSFLDSPHYKLFWFQLFPVIYIDALWKFIEFGLRGRFTQILIFFKIIYFTKMTMKNSFLVHFVLICSRMELEPTKVYKLFPNISLTKYDNKNLGCWLTKVNLLYMYI